MNQRCYLYWTRSPDHTDFMSQGYVGISFDYKNRLRQHISNSKHRRYNLEFKKLLSSGSCLMEVILVADRNYCLDIERILRPNMNIGWNIAIGGDGGNTFKHGLTSSKVKRDFYNMKSRCELSGVSVCNEWSGDDGLVNFADFMQNQKGVIVIPKYGEASPLTVRIVSRSDHSREFNKTIQYDGSKYSIVELGEKYGIKPNTITTRLRRGWTIEESIRGYR